MNRILPILFLLLPALMGAGPPELSSGITSAEMVDAYDCQGKCGHCMGCSEREAAAAQEKHIEDIARRVFREEMAAAGFVVSSGIVVTVSEGKGGTHEEPPHRTKDGNLTVAGLIAELSKVKDKSKIVYSVVGFDGEPIPTGEIEDGSDGVWIGSGVDTVSAEDIAELFSTAGLAESLEETK